jgi:hypothetical protein
VLSDRGKPGESLGPLDFAEVLVMRITPSMILGCLVLAAIFSVRPAYALNANAGGNAGGNNNNGGGGGGGGNAAGVIVSPDGVLRMKTFQDPSLGAKRLAEAQAKLAGELIKPSKLRKVSLTRLEAVIADLLAEGKGPDDAMKYLAGLTRLEYVFYYPETRDIVIAGPAEGFVPDASGRVVGMSTGRAVLELQDLIVALRAYGPSGKAEHELAVSIDPTAEGLKKMQDFLRTLGRITPNDDKRIALGLRDSLGQQVVTVRGVSPKTHFAQVLVEADYRMKLIGIGLERPPAKIQAYVDKAKPADVSRNAMQRWYFTPNYECVRTSEDRLAAQFVGEGVQLIGANELVNADGARVNNNAVDLASKTFTTSFTQNYPLLAKQVPVYAQMRNLIDMAIAAAFIQQQDFYAKADWKLSVFGDEAKYPVETFETPKTVESAVNVIWKGATLMTPIGGGVKINPRQAIDTSHIQVDTKGEVNDQRNRIQLDKLSPTQWWWD